MKKLNKIYCKIINNNCLEVLPTLDKDSIDLIVTSPPYNLGKEYRSYSDKLIYNEYLGFLFKVWQECYRVLKYDGRICLNLPNLNIGGNRYFTISHINSQLEAIGFKYRNNIVWNKLHIHKRTAWGSWKSPSNPVLMEPYEFILVYSKKLLRHKGYGIDITKEEFIKYTNSLWSFPGEIRFKKYHPSPFPEELPYRCVKLFTYIGDWVLDPFLGIGTTCKVARDLKRNSIGIEMDPEYCEFSRRRIFDKNPDVEYSLSKYYR